MLPYVRTAFLQHWLIGWGQAQYITAHSLVKHRETECHMNYGK